MTVRFKCKSEYQQSYRAPRSRSVSPQRSHHMGLQRGGGLASGGLARSCGSLLCPPDPQPPTASRSRSAPKKASSLEPNPPTPPEARAEPESPAEPGTPARRRPAHRGPSGPAGEPGAAGKSVSPVKPRPSKPDSQSQLSSSDGQQLSANDAQHALRWRAGLRSGGQRSGGQRSEYHRQFNRKKPTAAASPLLTAEQMLHSSSRCLQPFKVNPVSVETEYQRSFQGLAPPTELRIQKHLEQQRGPLFHTHLTNRKRMEVSAKKPRPKQEVKENATPPRRRMLTEYESSFRSPLYRILEGGGASGSDGPQMQELRALRQQALSYRRRAWGANFSRDHLSQLLSQHNALWEPSVTTATLTPPPSPRPPPRCPPAVEALDLASNCSQRSSMRSSVETHTPRKHTHTPHKHTHTPTKNTHPSNKAPPSPSAERRMAWGEEEEEEEEENTDGEEGRLPTPRLKLLPVQRTHHDLTTPATGGAILVGKLRSSDESSLYKQRCGSAVSMAAEEAWPEDSHAHLHPRGPSPCVSPPSKPILTSPAWLAPPPHGIHGTLRHADFQHNGDLGLRSRELQGSGGSDEDDRLSVMSWRSAASCSAASAVLERAQKRRENFWGKR